MSGTEGECGMTIWDTIFKAVFVVAVPIWQYMPVCMWGSGPNMTLPVRVRRAAARRGADAEGGSVSGNLENGAGI